MRHVIKYKRNNILQKGFTIIEVLIVLAIAGLILLIVFLAVPAMQRNARNTQRNNDVSRVVVAFRECMNTKNGQLSGCDTLAKMSSFIDITSLQQLTKFDPTTPGYDTLSVAPGKCNDDGTDVDPSKASGVTFVYLYLLETSSGTPAQKCIDTL